jgi:hypothetical protein
VRLADRVFAPHYVRALPRQVIRVVALRDARAGATGEIELAPGDTFELLDITGGIAWGIAPAHGRVGYLAADALGDPA